ncbi:calpain-10 [Megalops cyprinoides]|uniref:calpain-10 n=1 Tax=Megalops cyprinoides TaxID=118141 RepID=UPI001864C01E|nr:calpain-10 [Megalops cyprinoides]XP_036410375.1 calpain-10 [Megalops cyprinoides]
MEEMEEDAKHKKLFEDADFPPRDCSLFSDYTSPISKFQGDITWMRPQEICQSPKMFPENPMEGYAKQGLLGDCWFLCACTMLLKNNHLMNKVLPAGQPQWSEPGYEGRFAFRFWQLGCWVDVEVDDQLPCIGSKLCFSHCQSPSAFWVPLLEKAYAKLHGSYEHLWAGQVSEALVDLTGGLAERWSLKDSGKEEDQYGENGKPKRKLDLSSLQEVRDRGTVSCSMHSSSGGAQELGQYHALSVMEWTDVRRERGGNVRLLRIRNPWGRRCWEGDWRESGDGWSQLESGCSQNLLGRTQEGEFWVEEAELLKEFDEVTVGYPVSDQGFLKSIYTGKELPHSQQIRGCWVRSHSAGGCRNNSSFGSNPKFWLRMFEPGEVLVSLLQHRGWRQTASSQRCGGTENPLEGSSEPHLRYQAIGLHMWKVEKKHFNLAQTLNRSPCASTHCHAYEREVTLHTHLSEGYHLLIPNTFLQGAEASFLLRVFSSAPVSLSALKAPVPPEMAIPGGEWETSHSQGKWIPGRSAGGSRNFPSHPTNPHIPLTVSYESGEPNVRIALRQHCPAKALQPIGFHVYQVPKGLAHPQITQDQEPRVSCVPHCYAPEVTLHCSLPPGAYVIVPSTYQPDCKGHFSLTVARKIHRKVMKSQEALGTVIQEVSNISVMQR